MARFAVHQPMFSILFANTANLPDVKGFKQIRIIAVGMKPFAVDAEVYGQSKEDG